MKSTSCLSGFTLFLLFNLGFFGQNIANPVIVGGRVYYHHYSSFSQGTLHLYAFKDSVIVKLKQNGVVVAQDTIDNQGYYQFDNVATGVYTYEIECHKKWGGAAATDALSILRSFVGIVPLSGLSEKAAHSAGHTYYNSLDAFMGEKRFVGAIQSFPAGDWCWDNPIISVDGSTNITQDIHGMCYGDVNGSYIPLNTLPVP
jgi:hypothetical protein